MMMMLTMMMAATFARLNWAGDPFQDDDEGVEESTQSDPPPPPSDRWVSPPVPEGAGGRKTR